MLTAWRRICRCTVRTQRRTFCPPPAQGIVAAQAAHPSACTIIRATLLIVHGQRLSDGCLPDAPAQTVSGSIAEPIIPFIPERGGRCAAKPVFPASFPLCTPPSGTPFPNKLNLGKGGQLLGANPFGAFSSTGQARQPKPNAPARCRPARRGLPAPLRRFTNPPTPMAGWTTPHARGRAPGCVATGPLWGQGRLRPGSFVDTGLHHSMVAAIPVWARSATGPDPRSCAIPFWGARPAAALRREAANAAQVGGWRVRASRRTRHPPEFRWGRRSGSKVSNPHQPF